MKDALIPLIFFAQFDRPLTLRELRRYGWGGELDVNELKQIIKKSDMHWSGEFCYVDETHIHEYARRRELAKKFWQRVRQSRWIFANVPFIKLVAVGNTLAYDNVHENSDIDLFVVTRARRGWTARAILLLWLSFLGLRVRSVKKYLLFSPEFFVDETALDLSLCAIANDYYLAYWLADLVPVWQTDYFEMIWSANKWLKDKLPVAYRSPNRRPEFDKPMRPSWFAWGLEKILVGKFGDRIEAWVRIKQQRIIERNKQKLGINPSVIADDHVVKIHFNDRRAEVRERIEEFLAG